MSDSSENSISHLEDEGKRDFIYLATGAVAGLGAVSLAWPFVMQMDKAADTLAAGSIEINLDSLEEGQQLKTLWRGKPVFVRHRTAAEISEAVNTDISDCPDPQLDSERLVAGPDGKVNPKFLVMVGVCTHFGCVPVGEAGDFDGWYCPCHGSHYDTSGRIRKGPAPKNMEIPPYEYLSASVIKVG
jgi:ubiquinol-cytochrome c reductase iron-sulfur subunit